MNAENIRQWIAGKRELEEVVLIVFGQDMQYEIVELIRRVSIVNKETDITEAYVTSDIPIEHNQAKNPNL